MGKDRAAMDELYSLLINPCLTTTFRSYQACYEQINVILYTRRPQVQMSAPEGVSCRSGAHALLPLALLPCSLSLLELSLGGNMGV